MRARDLAVEYETVGLDSDALDAARLMAEHRLPALLVVDGAAVVDERHADRLCSVLAGRKVRRADGTGTQTSGGRWWTMTPRATAAGPHSADGRADLARYAVVAVRTAVTAVTATAVAHQTAIVQTG